MKIAVGTTGDTLDAWVTSEFGWCPADFGKLRHFSERHTGIKKGAQMGPLFDFAEEDRL